MTSFFIIWIGQAISLFGSQLVQFALIWWLTDTSNSATVLAAASMMEILPRVFISPLAGALVDRWDRRKVMLVADGLIALAIVVLAILYAFDVVPVWFWLSGIITALMGAAMLFIPAVRHFEDRAAAQKAAAEGA